MKVIARFRQGQTTLEYAILVVIVIGALLTIQNYLKRGIQGRAKSSTDDMGSQYDPGNMNLEKTVNSYSNTRQTLFSGISRTQLLDAETTNSTMSMNIANSEYTYWGTK